MSVRVLMLTQLIGTVLILAFLPGNLVKLLAFLLLWLVTFGRLAKNEIIFYLVVCAFFTVMNALSLKQGVFAFNYPDVLGMPVYELAMWGFYLLHTAKMLSGPIPLGPEKPVLILLFFYCVAFSIIPDQSLLLMVTAILLGIGLYFYHEKFDIAYVLYMVILGAAIEYTGVLSGQWHYPDDPWSGVPFWFVTLWGGVGLFLRRIALPLVYGDKESK